MTRMMRPLMVVFFAVPFILGMGAFGEGPANKVPVPDKKYTTTFIDQMDVVTECSGVSIEGNTYLEGKKGEGVYTIPFDRIRNIVFRMKGGELRGIVKLTDGDDIDLVLKKEQKAYGRTQYGTFQIKLANLKKMIISAGKERTAAAP